MWRGIGALPKRACRERQVVDMIRNDLGRIAEVGSVEVPALFIVERYPNVWQMTSLVKARSLAPLEEVFAALHPSASVTGAPKVRTMKLLTELERSARGIYTGAIGHVPPDGLARFTVAIRTATIDRRRSTLAFGIGSGIVCAETRTGDQAHISGPDSLTISGRWSQSTRLTCSFFTRQRTEVSTNGRGPRRDG